METTQLAMGMLQGQHCGGTGVKPFCWFKGLNAGNIYHPIWNLPTMAKLKQ